MNKKNLVFVKIFISLAILGILLYKIGFKDILNILSGMKLIYILPVVITMMASNFIGGVNIKVLLRTFKIRISPVKMFKLYSLSWAISLFVPSRLGELSILYFLKKEKVKLGTASSVTILDKAISLIVVFLFAMMGLLIFLPGSQIIEITFIFVMAIIMLVFALYSEYTRRLARKMLGKYSKIFSGFYKSLIKIKKEGKESLLLDFFLTIVKWLVSTMVIFFLFISLNQKVPYLDVLLINSIVALIALAPVSISGNGVREYAAVVLFGKVGISGGIVASAYIAGLIIRYLVGTIVIAWLIKKSDFTASGTPWK